MRIVASLILLGLSFLISGCTNSPDTTFATRNAEVDFDLQSIVRTQSNDMLSLTSDLKNHAISGFRSAKKLDRDLEKTVIHMDQLHMNLPALLAAQDMELAELRDMINKGMADQNALTLRAQEVQTYRKSLVGSLDASAKRANITAISLESNYATGRADLASPTHTAQDLVRDLRAARTMIEMQL